jgi:putative component of toxin-antitoxin plasmid stabilization module
MIEIRKTDLFANWLNDLRDIQAKARALPQEMQET